MESRSASRRVRRQVISVVRLQTTGSYALVSLHVSVRRSEYGSLMFGEHVSHFIPANEKSMAHEMDSDELMAASKVIVSRNVDHHVLAATVIWDGKGSALYLTWHVDRPPAEGDEELCELSLGELPAQFTEVARADTHCAYTQSVEDLAHLEGLVFLRV